MTINFIPEIIHNIDFNDSGSTTDSRQLAPSDDMCKWLHLDLDSDSTRKWLTSESGIEPVAARALLADDARPRMELFKTGMLVILRGVNHNPGKNPEDMVSVRLWIDEKRVVSLRKHRLMAIQDIRDAFDKGIGPASTGDFLTKLAFNLVNRMITVVEDIEETVDSLEDEVISNKGHVIRSKLSDIRRKAISIRRYLLPQRDVMNRLYYDKTVYLSDNDRLHLREVSDRLTRYMEDLDSSRERASVTQEELTLLLSEKSNKTIYILSLIGSIFLPLSFVTGLLGINVGGIPGSQYSGAFLLVCVILVGIGILQMVIFRILKWF